jgi:hypothetical protein
MTEAKEALGERTTKRTIQLALEQVVKNKRVKELLDLKGSGIVSLGPDELKKLRSNE